MNGNRFLWQMLLLEVAPEWRRIPMSPEGRIRFMCKEHKSRVFCPLTAVATDLKPRAFYDVDEYTYAGRDLDMSDSLISNIVKAADYHFFELLKLWCFRAAWFRFRLVAMRYI